MKLVDSFDIDNNELDGLTPQQVFCLGIEWEMFRTYRQRRNRTAKETWIHDDFDEWRTITVKAKQEPE